MSVGLEELWLAFWIGVLVIIAVANLRRADRVIDDIQREDELRRAEDIALRSDTQRHEPPYLDKEEPGD